MAQCGHRRSLRRDDDDALDRVPEAEYFLPPLTTVRQDFSELGRRALGALVERISGGGSGEHLRVPPEFVVRASAAPPSGILLRQAGS